MNKNLIIIGGIIALLLLLGGCGYNGMVKQEQAAKSSWAQVENQYQRRNDLIGNLVNTVKGYADFEQKTLTDVIEARANATKITVNAEDLSPEKIKAFQQSQGQLSQALGRLMVVSEQYPQLRASEQFTMLQAELSGTENRVATARMDFNNAVQTYNSTIKTFPNVIFSGMMGFHEKGYFEAEQGAEKAPKIGKDAFK